MTIPKDLIQQLAQRHVVPFVGSGVSLAVKRDLFPTWNKLLGTLADALHDESKEDAAEIVRRYLKKGQLNKAASEALDELGPARFRDAMRGVFDVEKPDDADLALPLALWSLRPKLVVTTNYDRVLQWSNSAANVATNSQKGNLADLFSRSTPDKPFVWHVHGHISDPDGLILAPRQYDQLYREATDPKHPYSAARLQLRTLIGNHPLMFVGFGLEDEYVMDALAVVLEIFGDNLRPSYALLKTGDDRARMMWEKHKIQVVLYADYGEPLVELVTKLARRMNDVPADSEKLAAGPRLIPPAYVEWLTDECADVTPFGTAPAQGQSVCLQEVYVPPLTSRRLAEESFDDAAEPGRIARLMGRQSKRQTPREEAVEQSKPQLLLELLGERSLYVSGDPGSGKSTFCRWAAWLAAMGEMPEFEVPADVEFQEKLPVSLRGRLPVVVRLREFRDYLPGKPGRRSLTVNQLQTALKNWLDQTKPGGLCWSDVAPHLAAGSLLLILDGVDEMPPTVGQEEDAWWPRESFLAGTVSRPPHSPDRRSPSHADRRSQLTQVNS